MSSIMRSLRALAAVTLLFSAGVLLAPFATSAALGGASASASTTCADPVQITNGSFEAPAIPDNSYKIMNESQVPGWLTTASDHQIEIWAQPFQGVPAAAGRQFAELNANQVASDYQDLATTPGQRLTWSLDHRGRQGVDTMEVLIGSPSNPISQAEFSDGNTAWGFHQGSYTVPAGQTTTRFEFKSISSAGGNPSIGNFLDNVAFGTPSCLVATKSVSPDGTANIGDERTYTIDVENQGGSPTASATVTDVLPPNTTLVPGSLSPSNGTYDANTRTVSLQPVGAAGTPGVIAAGEHAQVSFAVTIDAAADNSTVTNQATVTSTDQLGGVDTTTTNDVTTPVANAADVSISKAFTFSPCSSTPSFIPANCTGQGTFELTAQNLGPGAADGVTLTDQLQPVNGSVITLSGPLPSGCSAQTTTITTLTCTVPGTLAANASAQFIIPYTAPTASGPNNIVIPNTATVSSSTFDPNLSNNSSTASISVVPPAPPKVVLTKTSYPAGGVAGSTASFQITAFNAGETATATPVGITDTLDSRFTPEETTISTSNNLTCSLSGQVLNCTTTAPLDYGASAWVSLSASTEPTLAVATTLPNSASSDCAPSSATCQSTASATYVITGEKANLGLVKEVEGAVEADAPLSYLLKLTNYGPSQATTPTITDTLPAGTRLLETPSGCTLSGQTLTCGLSSLEPGTSATLSYAVALPTTAGTYTNTATAATACPTQNDTQAQCTATASVTTMVDAAWIPGLAVTGARLSRNVSAAALLVLSGSTLIITSRRRRRA